MADERPENRKEFQPFVVIDIYDEIEALVAESARMRSAQTSARNDGATLGTTAAAARADVVARRGRNRNPAARNAEATVADRNGHWIMTRSRTKRAVQAKILAAKKKKQAQIRNRDGSEAYRAHIRTATVMPKERPMRLRASRNRPEDEGTGRRVTRSQTKRAAASSK